MATKKLKFAWIISIIMFLGALAILLATIFEKSPIKYTNQPFPVSDQKVYTPGDELRFVVQRCASRPTAYTITRTFVSDNPDIYPQRVIATTDDISVDVAGCQLVLGLPLNIPDVLPGGMWHVDHIISIKGRYRSFIFHATSSSFMVKNDSPQPYTTRTIKPYPVPTTQKQTPISITIPTPSLVQEKITTKETSNTTTTTTNNQTGDSSTTNTTTTTGTPQNPPGGLINTIKSLL